jgi:LacI family transcriptional regulator
LSPARTKSDGDDDPHAVTERPVGIKEVAKHARVAISSVSRVLSGHPDVSDEMKVRVYHSVSTLGYTPDLLAQGLRRGQTLSVGFVAADISNPLLAAIAKGAESVLRAAGYSMLISDSEGLPSGDAASLRAFERRHVDGLLISLASEEHRETIDRLMGTKVPFVLVDREIGGRPSASAVLSDHRSGTHAAVDHLLDLGHRRIALISGATDLRPPRERVAGLRDAFSARGIADTSVIVTGPYSIEHGERSAEELLTQDEPPTAIVAGGNQIFVGLLRALRRHKLAPGRDISIVTCDDTDLTNLLEPPISAVTRDNVKIGRCAGELLLRRVRGEEDGERTLLPTWFVPTESCAPYRGDERGRRGKRS